MERKYVYALMHNYKSALTWSMLAKCILQMCEVEITNQEVVKYHDKLMITLMMLWMRLVLAYDFREDLIFEEIFLFSFVS